MKRSQWFKGFLTAEEEVKSGIVKVTVELECVTFHYPEGGSSGYAGDYQYIKGIKDYITQYENVIKGVLND